MINKADDLGFPERIAGGPLGGGSSGGATTDSGCARSTAPAEEEAAATWLAEDRRSVPAGPTDRSSGRRTGIPRGLRRQAVTLGHPLSPSLPAPISLSASKRSGCRPSRPGRGPWWLATTASTGQAADRVGEQLPRSVRDDGVDGGARLPRRQARRWGRVCMRQGFHPTAPPATGRTADLVAGRH